MKVERFNLILEMAIEEIVLLAK